ncbi:His Kinase A domain protein [uncultured delta proteobacterium]|uniref:histidine kinase n=1 Tax=uncultured delta proteobacterium TaxID=34034 RepID=A0A212JJY1_9DELT|nr:His Kinase A domain protein [uncultured delta proteobacterium]
MPECMEIIGSSKEKSTVYIAVLTLAFIGVALVASTWQILQRQKEASMEHLELTAIAVLQAVDSSLRRGPMMGRGRFSTDTRDFFRDLETSGDVLFVGMMDENGRRLVLDGETPPPLALPQDALEALKSGNRWQGVAGYGQMKIYLAARRIQGAVLAPPLTPGDVPGQAPMPRRHHRDNDSPAAQSGPAVFLAVAVDMQKHFAVYDGFRKTALFQTAYILAAAVFLWILAMRFLSRRKLAGKAVLLEKFQARLIDNLPDGLLIADSAGKIIAVNPAADAILAKNAARPGTGTTAAGNIVGSNLADIAGPLNPPVDPARDNGWQQTSLAGMQLEIRVLPFQSGAENDPDETAPARMVIVRDRTHIRTLEKNLAEAEKLAAIGSLAAGVAHEIRNPLSALRGFAQYFAKKLAGKQPEEEYARTMVRESDRLNRVITDLLYLARPRDLVAAPTDLAGVCDEMTALLHFELREQGLALHCDLETRTVNADPDALKQALLNLLLNALEALGSGSAGKDRAISLAARKDSRNGVPGVRITVADTGPGMTEEERAQARTPFYTTKKKGTGLGLALVQTIMQGHGGEISIVSPFPANGPGGCAVSLFFPDAAPMESTPDTSGA